jgi:hypothetical protein
MAQKRQANNVGFTINELARNFDETEATVRHLTKTLTPIGKRGRASLYHHADIDAALKKRISKSRKPAEAKNLEERKLELQCRKLEVEIDEKLGKLIPVDDVRRHFGTHTALVRTHLLKQPEEVAPLLEGLLVAVIEKKLKKHNLEILKRLQEMEFE